MTQSSGLDHESNQEKSTDRVFLAMSSLSVLAAVVAGFWLLGSPNKQRLLALDEERIADLSQIARVLVDYVGNQDASPQPLPETLPDSIQQAPDLIDPQTGEPYEYRRLSDTVYELCANFAYDSQTPLAGNLRSSPLQWAHPAGRHCF